MTSLTQTYDGSPESVTVTTDPASVSYAVTYDSLATIPTDAGSYAVNVTITDPNYSGSATSTLTINKATAVVTLGDLTQTYDNTSKLATAVTTPTGLVVDLTYDGSATAPTNAGAYTVVGTISDPNYEGSATDTLNIGKADQTITFNSLDAKTYGDADFVVSATAGSGLPVSFSTSGTCTVADTTVHIAGAGVCTVTAVQAGDGNYNAATNVDQTFTIGPKVITITADTQTKVYGETKVFAGTEFTTSDLVAGDKVASVTLTSVGTDATAPVNSYDIIPSAAVGTGLDNYAISYANGTLTVGKADLSVKADDQSRLYGEANPTLTGVITGIQNSDDITATYSTTANVTSPVASYDIVPAFVGDTSNYNIAITNGTLTIGKADLSVKADDQSRLYGEANPTLTGVITGIQNSDDITATYSTTANVTSPVASYDIVPAFVGDTSNYNITTTNGVLTVNQATAGINLADLNPTYDGTAKSATVTTDPASLTYDITYDGSKTAPINAGTYNVIATINDQNYKGSTSGTLVIDPIKLTVTAVSDTKAYDGTTASVGVPTITEGALATGDTVTWTQTFSDKNVGTGKSLIPAGTVNDNNGGNNYSITPVSDTTGVISAVSLTPSITADNKIYDGTTDANFNTKTLDGIIGTDDVKLEVGSASFDDKNVGTGKTVTASSLTLSGSDAGNYTLSTLSTTNTADITVRPITVTAETNTKVYDGNTTAAAIPTVTSGEINNRR